MEHKHIYFFGPSGAEGTRSMKPLLGGKGANLAEMSNLGLPVPAGFTITTEVCQDYYKDTTGLPTYLESEMADYLVRLEETTGKQFGGQQDPLLLSVRSGAAVSMPGMMDTVLNLGLNDKTVEALAQKSGSARFAYDSYRRFIQMFGNVVLGVSHHSFEHELDHVKAAEGAQDDTDLGVEALQTVIERYKAMLLGHGKSFPQDPNEQLRTAVDAVFGSWNNDRAVVYRRINNMANVTGTAVNVQAMVFGNLGETSGTGVAFTRNPSTGERVFFGEYLLNAQGEDVVAGIRTPKQLNNAEDSLQAVMPEIYGQLDQMQHTLEVHYKDMQDIEFTIEEGKLYLLQTRTGKRTAAAMLRIGTEMVTEGLITKEECLKRIDPEKLNELLHPGIDPAATYDVIAKGLPASPGVAAGQIAFDADAADRMAANDQRVILVRVETSPEDIHGMHIAQGVLTARGGMTSHAAVVARGMGKCCVSGCGDISIDYSAKEMRVQHGTNEPIILKEGDFITLNGTAGEVISGRVPTIPARIDESFELVLQWSDEVRALRIRTNADTPESAKQARAFGAEGIGLCRTEHMFFDEKRIHHMRSMILSDTDVDRQSALDKLLPYQQSDFENIFAAMDGLPVTVRLLDPPLHEFLPEGETEIRMIAEELNVSVHKIHERIHGLKEQNPMLGLRGCRLGITLPAITQMQTRALVQAAIACAGRGVTVLPEIMVPLVGHAEELRVQKELIQQTAQDVFTETGTTIEYLIGTMIELPRACLTANEIAQHAQFMSFGTNDLTQTTLGFSRDDSGVFIEKYRDLGILERDPFVTLDQTGVGQLVNMGVQKAKSVTPDLKTGICGEHGGDPESINFCHRAGLSYVSCSPFRVPVARVAAARAALLNPEV